MLCTTVVRENSGPSAARNQLERIWWLRFLDMSFGLRANILVKLSAKAFTLYVADVNFGLSNGPPNAEGMDAAVP